MPLLKFNLRWDDDINVERDIEILHSQSFYDFHEAIIKAFAFPPNMEAIIFVSNDFWKKGQAVSSTIEKNIRGAEALSMKRTPIGALLGEQYQKFVYLADHKKKWGLNIELISMNPDPAIVSNYPLCSREEGVSPATFGVQGLEKDAIVEIEEKFDINDILPDNEEGPDLSDLEDIDGAENGDLSFNDEIGLE